MKQHLQTKYESGRFGKSRSDLLEETSTSLRALRTAREEQPWFLLYKEDGHPIK